MEQQRIQNVRAWLTAQRSYLLVSDEGGVYLEVGDAWAAAPTVVEAVEIIWRTIGVLR